MNNFDFVTDLGDWTANTGPLYNRLAASITDAMMDGRIPVGTRLPSERDLADRLSVSRSTTIAAYRLLRAHGVAESRQGSGTRVIQTDGRPQASPPLARREELEPVPTMVIGAPESEHVDLSIAAPHFLPNLPDDLLTIAPAQMLGLHEHPGYSQSGLPALREALAARYTARGLPTSPQEILITSGAQQAISLIATTWVRPGDPVILEEPGYFGALDVFRSAGARLIGAPVERDGVRPEVLRQLITESSARLVLLVPSYQNPTGAVIPTSARREIAAMAGELGVTMIEDLCLDELGFDDVTRAPIASHPSDGVVLTVGSLSKVFWGGLRIGWVRGTIGVIGELARTKVLADLGSSLLSQAVAAQIVPRLDEIAGARRAQLKERLECLESLLAEHLPAWSWQRPRGGLCLWVKTHTSDTRLLQQLALHAGVRIIPGPTMSVNGACDGWIRLPFVADPEILRLGVTRLAQAARQLQTGNATRREELSPLV